jgi:hypothetical protein
MGNAIVTDRDRPEAAVSEATLNRTSLDGLFDQRSTYPSAHSDIAALMVFQHQMHMMNLITRVGWESRIAAAGHPVDFSAAPLREAIDELVAYALFTDAAPITAPLKGTSGYAEWFSAQGPFDRRGRSLHQLDLERRLLKYPCTYLIYSAAFRALPDQTRRTIYDRIGQRLTEMPDGRDVIAILQDTVPDLPAGFGGMR